MGKTFFDSLVKYCRTDVAYAALSKIETKTKSDRMESFFLAETLNIFQSAVCPSRDT